MFKRLHHAVAMVLAASAVMAMAAPMSASADETKVVRLGTDASQDAPPAQDLTFLDVGRHGSELEVRIGVFGILPQVGGIQGAGIQWTFVTRGRTFIAEAHSSAGEPGYTLYQVSGDTLEQIAILEGTYDYQDGFIRMLIPMSEIGAKPGSRLSGAGDADVEVHQHAGPVGPQVDSFATEKDYVVPRGR